MSPLNKLIRTFMTRHEPPALLAANFRSALAAILGIAMVGALAAWTELPLLLAPLGATVGLIFGQPSSPLSQPINVMGGYLVGTVVCEVAFWTFPGSWQAVAVAVGIVIFLSRALRVTHPPAAAVPLLGYGAATHGLELFFVVFVGCVTLIVVAIMVHNLPPRRPYPVPYSGP